MRTSEYVEIGALKEVTILSPHRDDAAFSCGLIMQSLLAAGAGVRVVNVCTQSSYAPWFSALQPPTLAAVTELRKKEDEAFFELLTEAAKTDGSMLQTIDLGWLDAPDRWDLHPDHTLRSHALRAAEVELLREAFSSLSSSNLVLAPLALGGHVDHQLVKSAALLSIPANRIALYEDLPYAARAIETAAAGTAALMSTMRRNEEPTRGGPASTTWNCRDYPPRALATLGRKQQYALCYPSQIDGATAKEIGDYSESLGGRERICGPKPVLNRMSELFDE